MQPPQSAFFPRTRNTFPGVMIARGSDALIPEMARSMSWSEMQLQWHTIIRPVALKRSGFARCGRCKKHMPFNSRLKQSSMSGLFPLLRSCFGISCKKCATARNRHNRRATGSVRLGAGFVSGDGQVSVAKFAAGPFESQACIRLLETCRNRRVHGKKLQPIRRGVDADRCAARPSAALGPTTESNC